MAVGFQVRGGRELDRISRQLRQVGDGREIRKRFSRELRSAAKPMVPIVRQSIRSIPTRGTDSSGLRERMARAVRLTVRTSGRQAGVAIRVDGRKMPPGEGALPAYMEGTKRRWRHPVYGNRQVWAEQDSNPYFYRAVRPAGTRSRRNVNKVIDSISKDIT